jgi:hypothetical protein
MTDLEELANGDGSDMTQFYRVVATLNNYVRQHQRPIDALDEIAKSYKPSNQGERKWLNNVHNELISSWIRYSPEIQRAMRHPISPADRALCTYRDTIEYILSNGEWK